MTAVIPAFVPASHQAAAIGLVDVSTCNSRSYKDRLLRADQDQADINLLCFSLAFLKECQRRGWPMFPHTYHRDKAAQDAVNHAGNSKAKWGQSPHNFGLAVDIVHFGKFWELDRKEWDVLGLVGKEVARRLNIKITWGGDWKFYDPAHWELTDWKERRDASTVRLWKDARVHGLSLSAIRK